jgi:hypothetical protein
MSKTVTGQTNLLPATSNSNANASVHFEESTKGGENGTLHNAPLDTTGATDPAGVTMPKVNGAVESGSGKGSLPVVKGVDRAINKVLGLMQLLHFRPVSSYLSAVHKPVLPIKTFCLPVSSRADRSFQHDQRQQ